MVCDAALITRFGTEVHISIDAFESFARLAGAVSLLALYKIGRGSGRHRARQRAAEGEHTSRSHRGSSLRGSSPSPGPTHESRRERWRPHAIVAGLWIVLSLVLLGYATLEGELAFADLDRLDLLATYSWSPIDGP